MTKQVNSEESKKLIDAIIEGIQRKKGLDIIIADLTKVENTECDHFIICHGTSNTQVGALASSVEETVKELLDEQAWQTDGYRNAQWILLDYANIMVHVFQKEYRDFYDIEGLWADANFTNIESEN